MAKQPFENVVQHLFQIAARAEFKTSTDQELLKRFVEERDELAFGELVRRYKGMVWYVCWRVLRHHQDVEDAFQAAVMTLARRAKTILGRETIEGWLHKAAFKVASNAKVARVRRHAREERIATMRKEHHESPGCRSELGEVLDQELTRIPEKYRSPLILCYLNGLTWSEAAQRLGISPESLKWRLEEGRERLKKRLTKYDMDLGPTMLMANQVPGVQVPEVPSELVDRTLDMVRIMMQSNGVLETAGISAEVTTLVKEAIGLWSLKAKIVLGLLLSILVVAGSGMVTYSGWLYLYGKQRQERSINQDHKTPEEQRTEEKVPPRTDLYGDPLPPGALHRLGTVRFRPACWGDDPQVVAFTPDGKSLLTIGKFLHLWDIEMGKMLRQFGDGAFRHAVLSSHGKWIAGFSHNKLYVWETAAVKLVRLWESKGNPDDSPTCAFSADSQALVARLSDDIKDVKTGKVLGQELKLCLLDIATGQRRWEQKLCWTEKGEKGKKEVHCRHCMALATSTDGTLVADGSKDQGMQQRLDVRWNGVVLRDARTGQSLRPLGHPWPVKSLSFAPDSRTLLVLYDHHEKVDSSVYMWDVATGQEKWHADKRGSDACAIFSPDGTIVALSQRWSTRISLREAATGKELRCCQQDEVYNSTGSLVFSPDGKVLAAVYGHHSPIIRCWEVASGKILALQRPFPGHESAVDSVAFTADGRSLVSGGSNQAVHRWDAWTGRQQLTLRQESRIQSLQSLLGFAPPACNFIETAAVSPDGKMIAGSRLEVPGRQLNWNFLRAHISLWDAVTGRELRQLEPLPRKGIEIVARVTFSPNGKFLAACLGPQDMTFAQQGRVLLYEIATGKIRHDFAGVDPTFSPDSTRLLTRQEAKLALWDISTGKKVISLALINEEEVGLPYFTRLSICLDWQSLAFGAEQKISMHPLYGDKPSALRLGSPRPVSWPKQDIRSLALSPDGKMVAAAGDNFTIYVWETATGKERMRFPGHKGPIRSLSFSPDGRRLASGSEDTTILVWDVTSRLDDQGRLRPVRLSPKAREEAWELLKASDAIQAHRVIWNLVAARSQTVSFLAKYLHPAVEKRVTAAALAQLIADLDSDTYAVRKRARQRLEALGEIAEPSLRQALDKQPSSVEVHRTLQFLLAALDAKRTFPPSGQVLRELRSIEILEQVGTREARQVLMALSQGTSGALLTQEAQAALHRLQR